MKIDYIPLANVPTVESLTDSAKVLVVDSGEVKKTAKSNIGGGGGGGSSDFTTAEVTLVGNNGVTNFNVPVMPICTATHLDVGAEIYEQEENTKTYSVALYKGVTKFYDSHISVTSGSATVSDSVVTITGNCTLTYTPDL